MRKLLLLSVALGIPLSAGAQTDTSQSRHLDTLFLRAQDPASQPRSGDTFILAFLYFQRMRVSADWEG